MSMPHRVHPDRWIFWGLLALVAWLPLPWASTGTAARAGFGLAVGLLGAAYWALYALGKVKPPPMPVGARIALGLAMLWVGWILFQLVPLSPELLQSLSPEAHAVHSAVAEVPASPLYTISILPGATLDQLVLTLTYLALFLLTAHLLRGHRERQRLLLLVLVLSGVGQALYGTLMTLSGIEYGFLGPKPYGHGVATGTFINRNHLAGYLELSIAAGVALILADLKTVQYRSWRDRVAAWIDLALSPRMRMRVLVAVMVIGLVMTRSRMGNLALFSALVACGSVFILLRFRHLFVRGLLLFASLLLVDVAILSENYGLQQLVERYEQTDLATEQRSQVFAELEPVAEAYRWTGSGLGSFASAYSPSRSRLVARYFDHAHNDHVEFLIEVGWPGYALLLALGLTLVVHGAVTVVRRRNATAAALGFVGPMALTSLGIHGLADFNLQIPAVAATLVCLAAVTLSCSARPTSAPRAG